MDSDLYHRLDQIAGPTQASPAATIEADLTRGRSALRRHRFGQFTAASGAVAAVAAAALAGALALPATGGTGQPGASGTGTVSTRVPTKLVAYTGKQPTGFTLDEVPEGWEVQGVNKYVLTLAPKGIADRDPNSFAGKIAIMLEDSVPDDVPTTRVTIAGRPGLLETMKDATRPGTLFIRQDSGTYLVIQVWDSLGWGEPEIVRFAGGVHVERDARVSAG